MKFYFFLVSLLIVLTFTQCSDLEYDNDDLLILNENNFGNSFSYYENIFVMFITRNNYFFFKFIFNFRYPFFFFFSIV